jgi:hypothetical protein
VPPTPKLAFQPLGGRGQRAFDGGFGPVFEERRSNVRQQSDGIAEERRMGPRAGQSVLASREGFFVTHQRRVIAGKRLMTKLLRRLARWKGK